jgi:hypothetical protein
MANLPTDLSKARCGSGCGEDREVSGALERGGDPTAGLGSRAVDRGEVFKGHDLAQIMTVLSGDHSLQHLYTLPNGTGSSESVGLHTESVMNQLIRYPFRDSLTVHELRALKGLIAFHDLEKYPEHGTRDTSNVRLEHERTERWMRYFGPSFGLSERDLEVGIAVLHSEVLGDVMRHIAPYRPTSEEKEALRKGLATLPESRCHQAYVAAVDSMYKNVATSLVESTRYAEIIHKAVEMLVEQAGVVKLPVSRYLKLVTAFYQSDCSTYTADSSAPSFGRHGELSMEFLFQVEPTYRGALGSPTFRFDSSRGRIQMRGIFEQAMRDIEEKVRVLGDETNSPEDAIR